MCSALYYIVLLYIHISFSSIPCSYCSCLFFCILASVAYCLIVLTPLEYKKFIVFCQNGARKDGEGNEEVVKGRKEEKEVENSILLLIDLNFNLNFRPDNKYVLRTFHPHFMAKCGLFFFCFVFFRKIMISAKNPL